MKKRITALLLVIVMLCAMFTGCSNGGVMNDNGDSGSAADNGDYSNGKTYEWKLASAWGEGSRQFAFDQRFCERVVQRPTEDKALRRRPALLDDRGV